MLKLRLGMSKIKIKHYAYLVIVTGLLVVSLVNIVANIGKSVAEANHVTITSPAPDQKVQDSDTKIKGTAPPLKEVVVYDGSRRIGSTTSLTDGTWSVDWTKLKPGQHNLEAYIVDGDLYQGQVLSQNSVKGVNVNSGQVNRNFAAGFSGSSASFYDSQSDKAYTINTLSGTISVVDANTNETLDTFAYRGEDTTMQLVTEGRGSFCGSSTIWWTCAYTYDDEANLLYLLEDDSVYVINTDSKNTQFTVNDIDIVEDAELDYRLYLDPAKDYLYVYHRVSHDSNNKIQRIDLDSHAISNNFDADGTSIAATVNGEVFYGDPNNGLNFLSSDNAETPQSIDVSSTGCPSNVEDLALASDDSRLYVACEAGSTDKVAIVNVADKQISGSFDRNGPLLTYGNLKTNKLLLSGHQNIEDADLIDVYNTSSQLSEQSIYPIQGQILPGSLIVKDDKIVFSTIDSGEVMTRIYVADPSSSNNNIVHEYEYSMTDFWGIKSAMITTQNKLMFLPILSGDTLGVVDLSDGGLQATVTNGMGAGGEVEYSKKTNRVFSISAPIPLAFSTTVSVADASSGSYEGTVKLPGYVPVSMAMDETGDKVYVIAVSMLTGSTKVFAVDTQSLVVVNSYASAGEIFSNYNGLLFAYKTEVKNNKLVFNGGNEFFVLDLLNDSLQSRNLSEDSAQGNNTAAILGPVTLNSDGTKLAILARQEIPDDDNGNLDQVIKIYNTADLTLEKTIFMSSYSSLSMYSAISFDKQDNLYAIKSSPYPGLFKPSLDLVDIDSGDITPKVILSLSGSIQAAIAGLPSLCFGSDIDFDQSNNYALLNFHCYGETGENTLPYKSTIIAADLVNGRALMSKSSDTKQVNILDFFNLIISSAPDFNVVSAQRQVDVVASSVAITSPSNNAEIGKGIRRIKGTAPPNRTLTIKVDNISIGTVESDEYGVWQKTYNFSKTKKYKINAAITKSDQSFAYATLLSVLPVSEDIDFSGTSLGVIDPAEGEVLDEFKLPSPYLPYMPVVKGNSIYTLAVDPNSNAETDIRFYKLDKDTGSVQRQVSLNDVSVGQLDLYALSDDLTELYLISHVSGPDDPGSEQQYSFRLFDLTDGSLTKTVNFTANFSSSGFDPFSVGRKIIYVDSLNTIIFLYPDGTGSGAINLDTEEVTLMPIPEEAGVTLEYATYDKAKDKIYSIVRSSNAAVPTVYVTGAKVNDILSNPVGQPQNSWTTEIAGYNINPIAAFSPDRESLVLVGSIPSENPNVFSFAAIQLNVNDGTFTVSNPNLPDDFSDILITAFSGGGILPMSLDTVDSKLYGSLMYMGQYYDIGSLFFEVDLDSTDAKFSVLPNAMLYQASHGSYARMSGSTISDEKTVRVVDDKLNVCPYNSDLPKDSPDCNKPQDPESCPYAPALLKNDPDCKPPEGLCLGNPQLQKDDSGCHTDKSEPCPYISIILKDDPNCNKPQDPEEEKPKLIVSNTNGSDKVAEETVEEALRLGMLDRVLLAVKSFAASVPEPLVYAFPYMVYVLLVAIFGYYLYQTQKQLRAETRLRKLFDKQKVIVEEKTNFLELASHYLRTPLTYIRSGSEMAIHKGTSEQTGKNLTNSVERLALFIESLIEELDRNKDLKEIKAPDPVRSPLMTLKFWLPTFGLIGVIAMFYVVFGVIGEFEFTNTQYLTHILITFLVVQLLYGTLTNRQRVIRENKQLEEILTAEQSLDEARTKLMKDAGIQLKTRTYELLPIINQLDPSASASKSVMQQGVARLQELATAFLMVGKLEASRITSEIESVPVNTVANEVIESMVSITDKKKIKVQLEGFDENIILSTNKPLIELVLKSLINNAVNASEEGATIVLKCLSSSNHVAFQVADSGVGIPDDKIDRLFKPFVRVGPVTTFNNEGVGLSLYLDRLIMHILGGEISLASTPNKGTVATLTLK